MGQGFLHFEGEAAWGGGNADLPSAPPTVTSVTSLSLSFLVCIRDGPRMEQALGTAKSHQRPSEDGNPGARDCPSRPAVHVQGDPSLSPPEGHRTQP